MKYSWVYLLLFLGIISYPVSSSLDAQDCFVPTDTPLQQALNSFECGDYALTTEILIGALENETDPLKRADLQILLGRAYLEQNNGLDAQIHLERAFLSYNAGGDSRNSGITYYYAGLAKLMRQMNDDALRYFYEGIKRSTAVDDQENLALLHTALAGYYYRINDFEQATRDYQSALTFQQAINDQIGQVVSLRLLGDTAIARGMIQDAQDYFSQSLELGLQIGLDEQIAYTSYQLGALYIDQGNFSSGESMLNKARDGYILLNDSRNEWLVMLELARAYIFIGEYTTAYKYIEEVLATPQNQQDCELQLLLSNYQGEYYIQRGEYVTAGRYFGTTLNHDCAETYPNLRAQALHGQGISKVKGGRYVSGGDDYQFALKQYRDIKNQYGEREVLQSLGELNTLYYDFQTAQEYFNTATQIAQQTGSHAGEISVQLSVADMYLVMRDYDRALQIMQDTLSYAIVSENTVAQLKTLEGIARLYFTQARYDEALAFYEEANQLYPYTHSNLYTGQMTYYRALIYDNQGEFELAETFYKRAKDHFTQYGNIQNALQIDVSLGQLYIRLNRYQEAQALFNNLKTLTTQTGNSKLEAAVENNLGDLEIIILDNDLQNGKYYPQDHIDRIYRRVQERYERAAVLYVQENDENGQSETLYRLGLLGMRHEIPVDFGTGGFFQFALLIARANNNPILEMNILNSLGDYHTLTGGLSQALIYYNDAYTLAERLDKILQLRIDVKVATIYERQGNMSMAITNYQKAISQVENIYASISSEQERIVFGEQPLYLQSYERLIRYYGLNVVTNRTQDAITALNFAERSRARSYLFQLGEQNLNFGTDDDSQKLNEWMTLRDQLIDLIRQAQFLDTQDHATQIEALNEQIIELESQLVMIEETVEISALKQLVSVDVASLEDIQATLAPDTAMIVYYVLPETRTAIRDEAGRVFIWVITQDSIQLTPQYIQSVKSDLTDRIEVFESARKAIPSRQQLYQVLIHPIAEQIADYENLVIVPHSVLNYIPFEVLIAPDETMLIAKHNITYTPSATVHVLLKNQTQVANQTSVPLIFAYGGEDLLHVSTEARTVGDLVNGQVLLNEEATKTNFQELASNANLIHVAAHGIFDANNPLQSYLALASDNNESGNLSVQEIYGLSLRENRPLVVLSACQTVISSLNPGDELEGMTRAFLLTGARGVVATLWNISDEATADFMKLFYNNRLAGMSDAVALANAKRDLPTINSAYDDPTFWAGFILVGVDEIG